MQFRDDIFRSCYRYLQDFSHRQHNLPLFMATVVLATIILAIYVLINGRILVRSCVLALPVLVIAFHRSYFLGSDFRPRAGRNRNTCVKCTMNTLYICDR